MTILGDLSRLMPILICHKDRKALSKLESFVAISKRVTSAYKDLIIQHE